LSKDQINNEQLKVAGTGFLSLFSLIGLMVYGLPFFYDFWVNEFGWTRATVTSGQALGKIIVGPLFGFAAGWVIDKFGPRRLMLSGILFGGIALIGLGTMTTLWQFYLFYFFNALGYMCGGPLPNQVLISRWFQSARGKAMGIAYLGVGIGGMLVPQLARWLNVQYGWRDTLMILGVLMVIVAFPMAWFVKENPGAVNQPGPAPAPQASMTPVLKGWPFYLLLIGSMCSIGAVAGTSQNLKLFFSLDLKYSQAEAANVMSVVLGASIFGRLFMGWLADLIQKKFVMIIIYALVALSIPLLYFPDSNFALYLFAILFGIALGGDYMIIPLMAAELFGLRVMGRVMGIIITFDGLAEAFGPMLAARLRDLTGSYANGFAALIALALAGTVAVLFLPGRNAKKEAAV
jgi:sugar phosphate permease